MLAHDLRNPFDGGIFGFGDFGVKSERERRGKAAFISTLVAHLMKQARRQIRIVDRMITDILQLGAANAQLHIEPKRIELGAIYEDVIQQFEDKFQAKSLNLETDIPADLPLVYADPDRIKQVIVNLLDNASKYTPDRGTVNLSILHRTAYKVQVSICNSGPANS